MAERIELQAVDLFKRIGHIHGKASATDCNLRAKYIAFYKVLEEACYEQTRDSALSFSNLFSRLDYVCKEKGMTPSDRYAIQTMRRNAKAATNPSFSADKETYRFDLRALCQFVSVVFGEEIPSSLLADIPSHNRPYQDATQKRLPYVRAVVSSWTEEKIFAATDNEEDPFIVIHYGKGGYNGDLQYLYGLLAENMQLNLLDVYIDERHEYIPKLIVVHPDYLIDISALATCFREYGHHPLNYFINKIKPKANTHHILLGNLAGQFLDDYINEQADAPVTYANTVKKFFASSALEFCTCSIPEDFHNQARMQMQHIRTAVHDTLPQNIETFDRPNAWLEASFICESLGLQGRADLLQKDLKVLIEQKSGKRDEYNHRHKEDHYVQMMLYQGVLMYNFGQAADNTQTLLLYSKYTDGLMPEHFSETLFRECICLRNRIVTTEISLANGGIGSIIDQLDAEVLNEKDEHGKLWTVYQEPELKHLIHPLKQGTPLEQAYFRRFFTFVSKEQLLNKSGGNNDSSRGFAGLWHTPLAEKIEAGNILLGLKITSRKQSTPGRGYDLITLSVPRQGDDFLPNFRTGDIVILYAYKDLPDVRRHILMKGYLTEIRPEQVTVQLRNGQQNPDIIGTDTDIFAIEHDASDTSAANGIRGLYAFLSACEDRKALILGQRTPTRDTTRKLNGTYGRFDELIIKEKQCDDYFLLVGPPGTGKTSCALRYMVEEALTEPDGSLLLLSYTNRAVDEICNMLVESGIAARHPFIRIGNEASCDKRFTPYLMKNSLADCPKLEDIREKILQTRLFVGTTTAINGRPYLFQLKQFALAIIDEASQIVEPDLIGILSARHKEKNAIGKFILVGDYKQLPAIALQSEAEAKVTDPLLLDIGLTDCRNSLFERLYRNSKPEFRSVLHKQGRMHPAIADFPDHAFYLREQLEPIPLPHQQEECPYPSAKPEDNLDRLMLRQRMVFIASDTPADTVHSEKNNLGEARIVATLLKRIYRFAGATFDAGKTVGVIVPYRNQIAMIRREIAGSGIPALMDISIDTVERYQGSQRDVIIYSFTVRDFNQLNFLTANTFREGDAWIDRKLNVAVTRARKQLFLTGNPRILGANLTFYKLMEYIRIHNGYLAVSLERFCQGDFELPCHAAGWDLHSENYPLSSAFSQAFDCLAASLLPDEANQPADDTRLRELIAYGRYDFRHTDQLARKAQLYTYYYMRRSYCAARAFYETVGSWLFTAIRNVSGRVVFCDLGYESGASGFAFADVCHRLPHTSLTYVGICPVEEMNQTASRLFQAAPYQPIQTHFYPQPSAVPSAFWKTHATVSELVIINVSNLFDRISLSEARQLAMWLNQLVAHNPLNRYAVCYRDDAGERANERAYQAFCTALTPALTALNERMPLCGTFYYNRRTENIPFSETFIYEIRTHLPASL